MSKGQLLQFESFDEFEKEIIAPIGENEKIIINFWATWCKPCVEELPFFEQITQEENGLRVILVSLDFKNQIEKKLIPFVEKHKLRSQVIALLDGKYNDWIDKVSPEWSGALPGTLMVVNGKKYFYEKSYHSKEELLNDINSLN